MKFIIEDDDVEIVEPIRETPDAGLIHLPTNTGNEVPRYTEEQKEKIANDVLNGMSGKEAAAIYGVSQPLANSYARGEGMSSDVRTRVLSKKYDIQDHAVTKLMDTLNLLNPSQLRTKDQIQLMNGLAGVIDKMSEKGPVMPSKVELHLYAPNQKKESEYEVIEGAIAQS